MDDVVTRDWVNLQIKSAAGPLEGKADRIEATANRADQQSQKADARLGELERHEEGRDKTIQYIMSEQAEIRATLNKILWAGLTLLLGIIGLVLERAVGG